MAKYTALEITDKITWERFVLNQQPKSFLQSWAWGETNRNAGAKIIRLGFKKETTLVGVVLLIKEKAKRGVYLVAPGGPLVNWQDRKLVKLVVTTLKDLARKEKAWFVRIRPEIVSSAAEIDRFKKLGFLPAPMHVSAENTWVLDISEPEEILLSGMRKSTRYLIKKSLVSGLAIEVSLDPNTARIVYQLQAETITRHKFVGFSEKFFQSEITAFAVDGDVGVYICRKGNRVLAAAIIIFYGDMAYYHFSGSVSDFRDVPFSYFLQWEIIRAAKKKGCRFYNFWGIAPNANPHHRFAGVTLFKTGFGGQRIDWLHAQDLPVSPLYWATFIFETMRRIARRL